MGQNGFSNAPVSRGALGPEKEGLGRRDLSPVAALAGDVFAWCPMFSRLNKGSL